MPAPIASAPVITCAHDIHVMTMIALLNDSATRAHAKPEPVDAVALA